jgi:RNA polymerase sigma factor (sigma-70 family)
VRQLDAFTPGAPAYRLVTASEAQGNRCQTHASRDEFVQQRDLIFRPGFDCRFWRRLGFRHRHEVLSRPASDDRESRGAGAEAFSLLVRRAVAIDCSFPELDVEVRRSFFPASRTIPQALPLNSYPMTDNASHTWFRSEVLVHQARIERYLSRRGVARHDAQDLIQEAYIRLLSMPAGKRPYATVRFLMTTCRNLMIDARRRDRTRPYDLVADLDALGRHDSLSPERHLEAQETLERFNASIKTLPPRKRQVYWLRRVHQYSIKETAHRLGMSVNTVEQHLRISLASLERHGLDRPGRRLYRPSRTA